MTRDNPHFSRRIALRTIAGAALASVAGCLDGSGNSPSDGSTTPSNGRGTIQQITAEGTELVVKYSSEAEVDQINLVQPNGELFGQRDAAAGSQQVSFELGTSYEPGEYTVVALSGEETLDESSSVINRKSRFRRSAFTGTIQTNRGTRSMEILRQTGSRTEKRTSRSKTPGVGQKRLLS